MGSDTKYFGRKYRLILTPPKGKPVELDSELRIQFKYESHVNSDAVTAFELLVIGVSQEYAEKLLIRHTEIQLYAGYGLYEYGPTTLKLLYQGWMMYGNFYVEGVDTYMKITGSVYDFYANSSKYPPGIQKGWTPPFNSAGVLQDLVKALGAVIEKNDYVGKQINKAYTLDSKHLIADLRKFFEDHGQDYRWVLQNGKLIVRKQDQPLEGKSSKVGWDNGLLTLPSTSGDGITFGCLLNPDISPLSVVYIDPKIMVKRTSYNDLSQITNLNYGEQGFIDSRISKTGYYLVQSSTHIGDSRTDEPNSWITVVQCNPASPAPRNPS